MEDVVVDCLEQVWHEYNDICKCEKCREDIIALALNNLPPKYITSAQGRAFAKVTFLECQCKADVLSAITYAIEKVKKNCHANV